MTHACKAVLLAMVWLTAMCNCSSGVCRLKFCWCLARQVHIRDNPLQVKMSQSRGLYFWIWNAFHDAPLGLQEGLLEIAVPSFWLDEHIMSKITTLSRMLRTLFLPWFQPLGSSLFYPYVRRRGCSYKHTVDEACCRKVRYYSLVESENSNFSLHEFFQTNPPQF